MVSLNNLVLLSDVSRSLKKGWREHTSKLFSCSLYIRLLSQFECNGRSTGRFNALGMGRLLFARKFARDSLTALWLYGSQAAHCELDGHCVDADSDIARTD